MKHIILYENFQSGELFETETLPSGATLLMQDESTQLKPGSLYVRLATAGESKSYECGIFYVKSDGSKKINLTFTNEQKLEAKIPNGKLVQGIKMHISTTPLEKKDTDKLSGISEAWTASNEANCMAALDSFLGNCGAYTDVGKGKVFGKTVALTILEVLEKHKDQSPDPLKSMGAVLKNAATLNKAVIATTSDEQKDVNKAIVSAVKDMISLKKT